MSKRLAAQTSRVDSLAEYDLPDAIALLQELEKSNGVKYTASIDTVVKLGVDPKQSDQVVKGVCDIDSGRKARIGVIAEEGTAQEALALGAATAGMDDFIDAIKSGDVNYDYIITKPEYMKKVSQVARVLGPKGIMPNPKLGTVTADIPAAVKKALQGQVSFRTDKAGFIHCSVGRFDFSQDQLVANVNSLIKRLRQLKPASSKGAYIRSICVSLTMGPSIRVKLSSVDSMK